MDLYFDGKAKMNSVHQKMQMKLQFKTTKSENPEVPEGCIICTLSKAVALIILIASKDFY